MELGQPLAELLVVLGRQHLGGRHQGPLAAGIDGREQGRNRHHGFAAAHVPLHQPGHRLVPGQVGVDLGQHPPLGTGERKGQDLQEGRHQAIGLASAWARHGQGWRRVGGELAAPLQQAELQHQKFIKHQPPPGRPQALLVVWLVDLHQGRGQIEELLLLEQRARQGVAPGPHRPEQGLDRLANPISREPLREPVHGQEPADLAALQGRIRALQHLHQGVLEAGAVGGFLHQATHRHRAAGRELALLGFQPARRTEAFASKKPRHPQAAGWILQLQFQDREVGIAGAGEAAAAPHRGHDRGRGARLQGGDAHQVGVVEVVARVIADQVAGDEQAQGGQFFGTLGANAADLAQGGLGLEAGEVRALGWGRAVLGPVQPRRRRWRGRLQGPLDVMEPLAAAAHQALAAGRAEAVVEAVIVRQLAQGPLVGEGQAGRGLATLARQEAAELFAAPLKIAETPVRLQLQGLLQGPGPLAEDRGGRHRWGTRSWCRSRKGWRQRVRPRGLGRIRLQSYPPRLPGRGCRAGRRRAWSGWARGLPRAGAAERG